MTQTTKAERARNLQGIGIEGSMSRSPALGTDDPRHRIGPDRELEFLQRFDPDGFEIDSEQRVRGTGSFLNHKDTPERYRGSELFYAQVNATGTAIQFTAIAGGASGGGGGGGGGAGTGPSTGSIAGVLTVTALSTDTTVTTDDTVLLCDALTASFTVTLPTAVGNIGKLYHIKKTDATANTVTVDADGNELIDGATTAVLTAQYESITLVSSGSRWYIL